MIERARKAAPADAETPAPSNVVEGRFARDASEFRANKGAGRLSAITPSVSPELRALMRRLRLGRLLDTLPERLALARQDDVSPP